MAMDNSPAYDRIRKQLPGILITLALVATLTAILFFLVWEMGLAHGSIVYLIPVVIAATRWGIVPALVAAVCGVFASAYFFYPPAYSFRVKDPQEVIDLILFVFVAVAVSQLANRLKRQLEMARQREIDVRDLYAFSRRLAVAFDVSDIHAAIEDHLASIMQRNVVLFASAREASDGSGRRAGMTVPQRVLSEVVEVSSGHHDVVGGAIVTAESGEIWLVRAVSPKSLEFGVLAINLGHESKERLNELRIRVDAVLADATATLERLGVAHAISEARMRSQTDQLREALIGSVSHELRTPLASILGAATVLSAAPALRQEKKLTALVHDVRDEAERLNNDIQNLLDATRISSDGIKPHIEWAEPADIINSAVERCRHRLSDRRIVIDVPPDLPLIHVDPILIQQALVQIFDNAVKYSESGSPIKVAVRTQDGRLNIDVTDKGAGLTITEAAKFGTASRVASDMPPPRAARALVSGSPAPLSAPMTARSAPPATVPGSGLPFQSNCRYRKTRCRNWKVAPMSEPSPIVLVVDDEIQIRRFLRTGFELNGFVVHEAGTGAEAIRTATLRPIDLAIVDLGLPDMDGADVVERIRSWSSVPIIVLSVRSAEAQKVHLLETGADDYVVKPFGMAELLARVRVALRRQMRAVSGEPTVKAGPLTIDLAARAVLLNDKRLTLTPKEYRLLQVLAQHAGNVVTHQHLLKEVWGSIHVHDTHYLRIFVRKLRQKIEPHPDTPKILVTELGVGYRLVQSGAEGDAGTWSDSNAQAKTES